MLAIRIRGLAVHRNHLQNIAFDIGCDIKLSKGTGHAAADCALGKFDKKMRARPTRH